MSRLHCFIFFEKVSDNQKWQMSTFKNGPISLYCHFHKTIKEPGTSFQHSAEKMLEMFVIQHTII